MGEANGHVPDVLVLIGPTASGKSAVAYELAQHLGGEILSADSMQGYREVPLLTQQPPRAWQADIPHHFIACRSVTETWSAADFRRAALRVIADIRARGKFPIIVGGTGLYIRALLDGLCDAPPAQPAIRARLLEEIATLGVETLHARVQASDPVAAITMHPRDARRIIRALEVLEATQQPLSTRWRAASSAPPPWSFRLVGLAHPREVLYQRINARAEQMFADGVVEEVRQLQQQPLSHTASQIIGLQLVREHLRQQRPLADTMHRLQQQTRRYAKRQLTWFRREPRIQWLACAQHAPADLASRIAHHVVDASSA